MRGWIGLWVGVAACVGATKSGTTGETGTTQVIDSGTPGSTVITPDGLCVFDLDLWCFEDYGQFGAPSQTTGTCPAVDTASLLADSSQTWHGRCVGGSGLDFVAEWTGYGGPVWYFDATPALVAYYTSTDTNSYCNGQFAVAYGQVVECPDECVVDDPNGVVTAYGVPLPPC